MRKRVLVLFLVVSLLVICLSLSCAAQVKSAAAAPVTIPFELVDNRVIVDVTVNGKAFKCLLDTGANAAMSEAAAKELGLDVTDAGSGSGVG